MTYPRDEGCRSASRRQYSVNPCVPVWISCGQVAVPRTRTSGRSVRPDPVGSENSSATRGSRRMLKAFCGKEIDVVRMIRSASGLTVQTVGQVMGTPLRDMVASSQVR